MKYFIVTKERSLVATNYASRGRINVFAYFARFTDTPYTHTTRVSISVRYNLASYLI